MQVEFAAIIGSWVYNTRGRRSNRPSKRRTAKDRAHPSAASRTWLLKTSERTFRNLPEATGVFRVRTTRRWGWDCQVVNRKLMRKRKGIMIMSRIEKGAMRRDSGLPTRGRFFNVSVCSRTSFCVRFSSNAAPNRCHRTWGFHCP